MKKERKASSKDIETLTRSLNRMECECNDKGTCHVCAAKQAFFGARR